MEKMELEGIVAGVDNINWYHFLKTMKGTGPKRLLVKATCRL